MKKPEVHIRSQSTSILPIGNQSDCDLLKLPPIKLPIEPATALKSSLNFESMEKENIGVKFRQPSE